MHQGFVQISWSRRVATSGRLVLLTVGDEAYAGDQRIEVVRPSLARVGGGEKYK